MLEEKFKLPKDRFTFDPPFWGYALCCGVRPKVNADWRGKGAQYNMSHMACTVCNSQVGVIYNSGGMIQDAAAFLYQHWNSFFTNPEFFGIKEGFSVGRCEVTFRPHGSIIRQNKHLFVFKLDEDNKIVYNHCFYTNTVKKLELPRKSYGAFASLSEELILSRQISTKVLNLDCINYKWARKLEEFVVCNLTEQGNF